MRLAVKADGAACGDQRDSRKTGVRWEGRKGDSVARDLRSRGLPQMNAERRAQRAPDAGADADRSGTRERLLAPARERPLASCYSIFARPIVPASVPNQIDFVAG